MTRLPTSVNIPLSIRPDSIWWHEACLPDTLERLPVVDRELTRQRSGQAPSAGTFAASLAELVAAARAGLSGGVEEVIHLAKLIAELDPIERESRRRRLAAAQADTGEISSDIMGLPGIFQGWGRGFVVELRADESSWCELWATESSLLGTGNGSWEELLKAARWIGIPEGEAGELCLALTERRQRRPALPNSWSLESLRRAVTDGVNGVDLGDEYRLVPLDHWNARRALTGRPTLQDAGALKRPITDEIAERQAANHARRQVEAVLQRDPALVEVAKLKLQGYTETEIRKKQGGSGPLNRFHRQRQKSMCHKDCEHISVADPSWLVANKGSYRQKVGDRWTWAHRFVIKST